MKAPLLAILALALCACGERSKEAPAAAPASETGKPAAGIAWFNGTLDAAFEQASIEHKPVFVFWGAEWCPYCQSLKATVFKRPDFIEQTRHVIALDLDGDQPEAHKWGTEFKVVGYPTLLIFRPDRTEIARVSGGMDLNQYAGVLSRILKDERPISEVLATADSADACGRLAFHGWDLMEEGDGASHQKLAKDLTSAAARCSAKDELAATRLSMHALTAGLLGESDAREQGKGPSQELIARVRSLSALLADPKHTEGAIDILVSLDSSLYKVIKSQGAAFSEAFRKDWTAIMLRAADDKHYGESERLFAFANALDAEKELGSSHTVPGEMAESATRRISAALATQDRGTSRGDIINAARIVSSVLGDDDKLYDMLKSEIATSTTPYYYMPSLASIEEKRGRSSQALGWLEMAYTSTHNPGARAKWGATYVNGLTRLTPDDLAKIQSVAMEVADAMNERDAQIAKEPDRAARLITPLAKWATTANRKAVVSVVEKRLQAS